MFGGLANNLELALSPENLARLALLLPILTVSMVLHEMAHGYTANRLGDPTARMFGRLTANPLKHIDPMGSAMFAITWILSGGRLLFGWAKPIPVQPRFFKHPQRDFAIVALAGPFTNFAIAFLLALVFAHAPLTSEFLLKVLENAFVLNVWLAVFNLLPIPPLDGSRVVAAVMPRPMAEQWANLDRHGMIILMILLFGFNIVSTVVTDISVPIMRFMLTLAGA